MKSQRSAAAGDPRRRVPAPANSGAGWAASIPGSTAEGKAELFAGVSRKEQPPPRPLRLPHSSLSHLERVFILTANLFPVWLISGWSSSHKLAEDAGAVNRLTSHTD